MAASARALLRVGAGRLLSESDDTTTAEYAFGILLVVLGCFLNSLSLVILKRSADQEKGLRLCCQRKQWWLGFSLLIFNSAAISTAALALLPVSIVAPFGGLTIVFSTLFAAGGCLTAREPLRPWPAFSIVLIVAGVTLVAVYGPSDPDDTTMQTYLDDFSNTGFVALASAEAAVVFVFILVQYASPCAAATDAHTSIVGHAFMAAACGSLSQMFLKIVAEALEDCFEGDTSSLTSSVVWISLGGLAISAPLQLWLLNTTLASAPVAYAIPLYQSMLIILTEAIGGTFFEEFDDLSTADAIVFGIGAVVALVGIIALSYLKALDLKETQLAHSLAGPDATPPYAGPTHAKPTLLTPVEPPGEEWVRSADGGYVRADSAAGRQQMARDAPYKAVSTAATQLRSSVEATCSAAVRESSSAASQLRTMVSPRTAHVKLAEEQ